MLTDPRTEIFRRFSCVCKSFLYSRRPWTTGRRVGCRSGRRVVALPRLDLRGRPVDLDLDLPPSAPLTVLRRLVGEQVAVAQAEGDRLRRLLEPIRLAGLGGLEALQDLGSSARLVGQLDQRARIEVPLRGPALRRVSATAAAASPERAHL